MSGIRGDFAGLDRLREQLRAAPQLYSTIRDRLADESLLLVADEFQGATDPYGKEWLKSRRATTEGGITLSDTGRLANSFTREGGGLTTRANGFDVGSNVVYAKSHQLGLTIKAKNAPFLRFKVGNRWVRTKQVKMPIRQILPKADLPPIWLKAFSEVASDTIREHFEGP